MKRLLALLLLASIVAGCSERNVYPVEPSAPDSVCHGKSCDHKKDK